uniref:Uncharacterized protein n=1 Tax=Lygus hesperus TaxID=30085 RepID=A0A146MBC0_LYGHE
MQATENQRKDNPTAIMVLPKILQQDEKMTTVAKTSQQLARSMIGGNSTASTLRIGDDTSKQYGDEVAIKKKVNRVRKDRGVGSTVISRVGISVAPWMNVQPAVQPRP